MGRQWLLLNSPYAKGRVQNNSEGPLGFSHIACLVVSAGIVDCSELILQEKGKKSLRKSFHPLIIQKCPWLPSEGVCKLPHSDSPKGAGQVLSKPLTAKSPRNGTGCLGRFVKKSSPSMSAGRGAATCPHLPRTRGAGWRPAAPSEAGPTAPAISCLASSDTRRAHCASCRGWSPPSCVQAATSPEWGHQTRFRSWYPLKLL